MQARRYKHAGPHFGTGPTTAQPQQSSFSTPSGQVGRVSCGTRLTHPNFNDRPLVLPGSRFREVEAVVEVAVAAGVEVGVARIDRSDLRIVMVWVNI